jgi:hypothetical protein
LNKLSEFGQLFLQSKCSFRLRETFILPQNITHLISLLRAKTAPSLRRRAHFQKWCSRLGETFIFWFHTCDLVKTAFPPSPPPPTPPRPPRLSPTKPRSSIKVAPNAFTLPRARSRRTTCMGSLWSLLTFRNLYYKPYSHRGIRE